MKIIIKTKNLELTAFLQNYIEEKIGGLKKFISVLKKDDGEEGKTLAEVFVEIEKETIHHRKGEIFKAEAQIILPGKSLLAQATGEDLLMAIVEVKDELQQEIKKYKTKKIDLKKKEGRKIKEQIVSQ
jgi:ribosomal subunit interface protein